MPQAAHTPTTSRRALVLAGAASFATGLSSVAALPDDRDAALLAMLAEFDRLEMRMRALGATCLTIEAEDAAQAEMDALEAAQHRLYPPIVAARARTVAGVRARARNLGFWAPDLVLPNPEKGWDQQFTAALLRDLVALPG